MKASAVGKRNDDSIDDTTAVVMYLNFDERVNREEKGARWTAVYKMSRC